MRWSLSSDGVMRCPCLYGETAPVCRADTEALRIPAPDHLSRFCLSAYHRRCDVYRHFLGVLVAKPDSWRVKRAGIPAKAPRR